ncbi:MAG: glycosyltransferase family 1 protein [SAR202 cluster bacterium]|nr:glycosyltransferase family 1 protein [SAR202 cluster bacterium]
MKQRIALLSLHGCPVARLGERDTGGMNVCVLQVAKEFGRRGHSVDVFTRRHDPADPQIVELGENARVVHIKAGGYDETKEALYEVIPEFISNLHEFQRAEGLDYDLAHSHYWLSGRAGMVLARQWGVSHVATFHTLAKLKLQARAGEKESPLRVPTERLIMGAVDAMVVSTESEKRDIARLYGVSPAKITVVPPGVDLALFRPMDKSEARRGLGIQESQVVLYVGRLEPLKGIDILIQAAAQLDGREDTRVLVVGGNRKGDRLVGKLKAQAEDLGIGQKVTFTGPVAQSELPRYYNAADVFVLPSHYESFGLAALEAMACGVPVVVSRVGGLTTFISDGKEGYLIPWRCPDPFAQRIEVLLSNPALRSAMGQAARAKAERMGWGVVADRMLGFYDSLLAKAWESAAGA